ncbi:MAG: thioredoxin [Clostridia bacterium]|jgi:thioredoxin 1|nr:thioredoxin [Clostridia bacterium]
MNKKKKLIIEIILFVVLLLGITITYNYLVKKNTLKPIADNNALNSEEEKVKIMEIENAEQFEQEVNKGGVIFVDFYAAWCIPCQEMSPIIEEIAKEHKEVKVIKVDVDKNERLAIKYNVMNIPTMIVIKDGKVTKTFIGIVDKENIVREL